MRVTYDEHSDSAYVYLVNEPIPAGGVAMTQLIDLVGGSALLLDFDHVGHLVGIEVQGATSLIPSLLGEAEFGAQQHSWWKQRERREKA